MKDGLEISRICKHVFQVLASRCIVVSKESLVHDIDIKMHVRYDSSGNSVVNSV